MTNSKTTQELQDADLDTIQDGGAQNGATKLGSKTINGLTGLEQNSTNKPGSKVIASGGGTDI